MILVTGGTGFIGRALIRHLVELGYPVRTLIRPSQTSPNLPLGIAVDVAVSSLTDERGLRAAMVGIDTVFHLASGEWRGPRESLMQIDIQGNKIDFDLPQNLENLTPAQIQGITPVIINIVPVGNLYTLLEIPEKAT